MSLRLRIALTILLIGTLVSGLTTWRVVSSTLESSIPQVAEGQKFLLDVLRELSLQALVTEEYYELKPYLEAMNRDPDVLQVLLGDADDRVVAATRDPAIGLPMPRRAETADAYWRVREISVGEDRYGLLAVQFSSAPITRIQEQAYLHGLALVGLGAGLSALLGWIAGTLATRKLRMLMTLSEDIAAGNTMINAGLPGRDEVARLSHAIDAVLARKKEDDDGRQLLEEGLHQTQHRMNALLNTLPGPAVVKDAKGRWQASNHAARILYRLQELPWQDKTDLELAQLVTPLAGVFQADELDDEEVYRDHAGHVVRRTVPDPMGHDRVLELRREPIHGNLGNFEGIAVIGLDLTEELQRRHEQALREARRDATLAAVDEAIIDTDAHGNIVALNASAARLTGWGGGEAQGRALGEVFRLIHMYTRRPLTEPLHQAMSDGGEVAPGNPAALLPRGGEDVAVTARAAPVRDPEGRTRGHVVSFHEAGRGPGAAVGAALAKLELDPLTGLPNRDGLRQVLGQALLKPFSPDRPHVLAVLDVDDFKQVNQTLGHFAGDELLRRLAGLLRGKLRASDALAHTGGEEFALVLEDCPVANAEQLLEQLRAAVEAFRFLWQGDTARVTLSIGIVPIHTEGGEPGAWLDAARATCFRAKDLGGNRSFLDPAWSRQFAAQAQERHWFTRLREGLQRQRFQLYQQDARRLVTDLPGYSEILVRLLDEHDKPIPAREFMGSAERAGLSKELDRRVIRGFCEHHAHGRFEDRVWGVNLSTASLLDPGFEGYLIEQMKGLGVPGELLCLELSETAAARHLHRTGEFIRFARKLGCRIALDNVGSGTASFTTLKHLDVDYIKIAGGLIKILPVDPLNQTFAETLRRIADIKGVPTIAQWVEDDPTLETVERLGASYAQGYGIEMPKPLTDGSG